VPGATMAWQVQAAYPFAVGEPAPSRQYRLAGAAGHGVLVDGGRVVWATLGRVAVSCLSLDPPTVFGGKFPVRFLPEEFSQVFPGVGVLPPASRAACP
jgi:hypothetical protein